MTPTMKLPDRRPVSIATDPHLSSPQPENQTMQNLKKRNFRKAAAATTAAGLATLLSTGCSSLQAGFDQSPAHAAGTAAVKGSIHGGQQPVSGATLQIYTVGTSGPGSAATAIPGATTTSNSAGGFAFAPGSYNCNAATQVYILATGGNSGAGVNTSISALASLGSCATLLANASTTFISINELTTVAGVYALAPFMSDLTHVGATGSNGVGIVNAMALSSSLVNTSTGSMPGATLPAGATLPVAELNTLANIIAACINTNSPSSSQCSTLYAATAATDTVGAMLAIARNPASPQIKALYTLPGAAPPFQPALTGATAPNDFTVAIKYNASGTFNTPYGIAIDAAGNAWVSNESGNAVTKLSNLGTVVSSNSVPGLYGAKGIALDPSGNVWVANSAGDSVVKMIVTSGTVSGSSSYLAGSGGAPVALALDSAGNAWVANYNGSNLTELSSAGATVLTVSSTVSNPTGVALDPTGNVYVASSGTGKVVKLTHAGGPATGSPFTDNALQAGASLVVDPAGNVWLPGNTTGAAVAGAVSEFTSAGTAVAASPLAVAVTTLGGSAADTASVWIANRGVTGGLLQFQASATTAVSPAAGYGSLNTPVGVAVDPSGNVWTANAGDNTVSQFVGLGKPVTTPIAANVGP